MPFEPILRVNVAPTRGFLLKLKRKVTDLTPVFDGPIANRVHEMFGKVFDSEGSYAGTPWAPLSPRTMKDKERIHRGGMGILRRFNTLWASLTKRNAPQGYRIATGQSLAIGTSVPYAAAHQLGGLRLPKRPIVPETVPPQDLNEWAGLIVKHLEGSGA